MKKENGNQPEEIKTDLKHDTMEFSAPSEGEDILNIDTDFEEDDISAEELATLEDEETNEAAAYVSVENDLAADDDTMPEEDWTDDLPGDVTSLDEADEEDEI